MAAHALPALRARGPAVARARRVVRPAPVGLRAATRRGAGALQSAGVGMQQATSLPQPVAPVASGHAEALRGALVAGALLLDAPVAPVAAGPTHAHPAGHAHHSSGAGGAGGAGTPPHAGVPRAAAAPAAAAAIATPAPGADVTAATAAGMPAAALALLAAPYRAYAGALERHPLATKAATSCFGFILGDLLAQHMGHHGAGAAALDWARTARLGAYGLCIDGPLGALWYDLLEAKVNPDRPTATSTVLLKTALDQLVYATAGTALFFVSMSSLEGRPEQAGAVLAAKFWPTLAANWTLWPLAHLINFRYVPSQWRLLYNNALSVAWLALLSSISHSHGGALSGLVAQLHALAGGH